MNNGRNYVLENFTVVSARHLSEHKALMYNYVCIRKELRAKFKQNLDNCNDRIERAEIINQHILRLQDLRILEKHQQWKLKHVQLQEIKLLKSSSAN